MDAPEREIRAMSSAEDAATRRGAAALEEHRAAVASGNPGRIAMALADVACAREALLATKAEKGLFATMADAMAKGIVSGATAKAKPSTSKGFMPGMALRKI
jgi:hypothetical protein